MTDGQCPMVGGSSSLSDFPYSKFCMFVEHYQISPRENSGSDLWKTCNKHTARPNPIECIPFSESCKL